MTKSLIQRLPLARVLAGATVLVVSVGPARAEKGLAIAPVVSVIANSNALRTNQQRDPQPKDDVRITAGIAARYTNDIPLGTITLRGSFAYDKHTHFKFLDRENISAEAFADLNVAARCKIKPKVEYRRAQLDPGDSARPLGDTITNTEFSGSANCGRFLGFEPQLEGSYLIRRHSLQSLTAANLNSTTTSFSLLRKFAGIGTISPFVVYATNDFPDDPLLGNSNARSWQYGARFDRSISSILQFTGDIGQTRVTSKAAGNFTGLAYSGELRLFPEGRLSATLGAKRTANLLGGLATSYAVARSYNAAANFALTKRISINLSASQINSRYFGEDTSIFVIPRVSDRLRMATANVGWKFTRNLRLSVLGRLRERKAFNSFYDYRSTEFGISLGGNF